MSDIVNSINNASHRSLKDKKLTPNILHEITDKNFLKKQYHRMYDINTDVIKKNSHLFKIGDIVRIPLTDFSQNIFFKFYNPLNTTELFRIVDINKDRYPYLYKLSDLDNNDIIGSFYSNELTPSVINKIYRIRIIRTIQKNSKKIHLVHWLGWPESSNSWVHEKDIYSTK